MVRIGVASGGAAGECQISRRRVTLGTGNRRVVMLRHPVPRIMSECPGLPHRCAVACDAIVGIYSRCMVRVLRRRKICKVARVTILRRAGVFSADVALCARCRRMRPRQRECRFRMIECCRFPCRRCMADRAIVIEHSGNVVRIRHPGEICRVACITIRRCSLEHAALVAEDTIGRCMSSRERECSFRMAERGRLPRRH